MLKIILSDNTEIEVNDGSTIFDIMVESGQFPTMWETLTKERLKLVKLMSEKEDLLDQRENLVVDSENSSREKDDVVCHFYLREKTSEEILKERITYLEEQLAVHDGAITDIGTAVSRLAEEGGLA